MRRTVYLRLQQPGLESPAQWLVRQPQGEIGVVAQGTLDDALDVLDTSDRIVLVLPGAEALIRDVDLPIRQRSRLLQAVPYAMEEQLADDVDSFHFAVGQRTAHGAHRVVAINADRLEAFLEPLQAAGHEPDAAHVDCQMLPTPNPETGTVLVEDAGVLVRTETVCATLDRDLITLLPTQLGDDARPPQCYAVGQTDFSPGLVGAADVTPVADTLAALVAWIDHARPVNLLQGAFRPRSESGDWWRPWLPAAILLIALAGFAVAYQTADLLRLQTQVTQLEDDNLATFQALFPAEQRIVDLRAQLSQQLAALRSGGEDTGLLFLLDRTRRAFGDAPRFAIRELQYRDNNLFLSLSGEDLQALETLRERFAAQSGVDLEVQSANAASDGVKVRLKVSPA